MPSFSADGGISMPPAFENELEASKMTLLEKVLANSNKQFQPQALRSNQYGACHGQQPSKRTEQRHRQQAKKVIALFNLGEESGEAAIEGKTADLSSTATVPRSAAVKAAINTPPPKLRGSVSL
jgi:hypothetical protein